MRAEKSCVPFNPLLEGFDTNQLDGSSNPYAIWALAEQIDSSQLSQYALASELSTVQGNVATLQTQMLAERARAFESTGLVTVGTGEVIIELPSVPNDNSTRVVGQTSAAAGLFPFVEDEDYTLFGSWLFFRNQAGDRSVDDGDKLDLDWFTDLARPAAVTSPSIDATNITWTDSASGGTLDIYTCPSGSDETVQASWSDTALTPNEADASVWPMAVRAATGSWSD